jgi:hypothetical protein
VNAYQTSANAGATAVVAKLSPDGLIIYSTYLSGPGDDTALGIAVDAKGEAVVTGATAAGFPLAEAIPVLTAFGGDTPGSLAAFVSKFSVDGKHLIWSTTMGASGVSSGYAVAVGAGGRNAYVAISTGPGETHFPATSRSVGYNTANPGTAIVDLVQGKAQLAIGYSFRTSNGCFDCGGVQVNRVGQVFAALSGRVMKVRTSGAGILWSRSLSLPGNISGNLRAVALSPDGSTTVTGAMSSTKLLAVTPIAGKQMMSDGAFVGRINPKGQIVFSTFLPNAWGFGVAMGGKGNAVITGIAQNGAFPTLRDPSTPTPLPQCGVTVTATPSPVPTMTSTPVATVTPTATPSVQCPTAFVAKLLS